MRTYLKLIKFVPFKTQIDGKNELKGYGSGIEKWIRIWIQHLPSSYRHHTHTRFYIIHNSNLVGHTMYLNSQKLEVFSRLINGACNRHRQIFLFKKTIVILRKELLKEKITTFRSMIDVPYKINFFQSNQDSKNKNIP